MPRTKDPELERARRVQIMTTVALCLAAGSHRSLTLDRVAKLAGVSKGMVTYYFKTKDRLICEAMQHFLESQVERMLAIVREDRPLRDRLESLLAVCLPSRDEVAQELNFQTEVWSYGKENPDALKAIHSAYRRFREACREMVDVGVAEGYVTAPDAQWLYVLLHALIDGVSFQIVLDESLDVAEVRARVLRLIDTVFSPG
jgi:TetR/AcrR family fatty acid metabolism transcriptional regulator